jgi:hypothetical protein
MIRPIVAAVIVMLVTTAAPSIAFSQDEKSPTECGKYLSKMSEDLDTLEALVPNVPPEEASYLEKEDSGAIQSLSRKRIYDVEHRPLYAAWHLHNQFHWAREELKGNQRLAALPDLKANLKFTIKMAARLPHPMANAKIAWDAFDKADKGRSLTLEQVQRGAEKSEYLLRASGLYIWCFANFAPRIKITKGSVNRKA